MPGVFIVYHFQPNFYALIYPMVAQVFVESLLFYAVKKEKYFFKFDKTAWNDLIHFGKWNTASRIVGMMGNQADGIIIGKILGAGALGVYNRSYSIMSTLQNLYSQYLDNIIFADFARMEDDKSLHLKKIIRVEYLLNLFIFPSLLIVLSCSSEIILVLLGDQWNATQTLLQILTLGLLFRLNYKITLQYLRAQGYIKNTFYFSSFYLIVTVLLMLILSGFGLIGITLGYSLGLVFQYLQLHHKVSRVIPGYTLLEFLKANKFLLLKFVFILAFLMAFNHYLIDTINFYLAVAVKIGFVFLFFTKPIYHEITSILKSKNKKP